MMCEHEITLDEMWRVTEFPLPKNFAYSCRALCEALSDVEDALEQLDARPGSPTLCRLNCAWMLAMRRYQRYCSMLHERGRPA